MRVSLLLAVVLVAGAFAAPSAHIDPALRRTLKSKDSANIVITFKEGTLKALAALKSTKFVNRAARLNGVAAALRANAQKTQAKVLEFLNRDRQANVKSFWISNKIFIQNANMKLIESLSAFPEIAEITEEIIVQLDPLLDAKQTRAHNGKDLQWGVEKIQAHHVWDSNFGTSGEGIVVANIDTGVRHTHETLRDNFRQDHGWLDPYNRAQIPSDGNGHGTHTMGTIAGSKGVGVAPGSTWIACKGCAWYGCSEAALNECGQFVACPTDANGQNADCSMAPHVVSNSWGGGQGQTFYEPVIAAWHDAGIIPLFSAGNAGPRCGTANSPSDSPNVISVGSTTIDDAMSYFSSKGPAVNGLVKPDISAPGTDVYSAWSTGDDAYSSISGTSMACPHAAGVVALLLSQNPDLDYEEVKSFLLHENAQTELVKTGLNCGGIDESVFPNNAFGNGRIDAHNSFLELSATLGKK